MLRGDRKKEAVSTRGIEVMWIEADRCCDGDRGRISG